MRFLKGKSPRKELKFEIFRAAGAPIFFWVLGHNPKFVKKGGIRPPLVSERIWPEGGVEYFYLT